MKCHFPSEEQKPDISSLFYFGKGRQQHNMSHTDVVLLICVCSCVWLESWGGGGQRVVSLVWVRPLLLWFICNFILWTLVVRFSQGWFVFEMHIFFMSGSVFSYLLFHYDDGCADRKVIDMSGNFSPLTRLAKFCISDYNYFRFYGGIVNSH